MSDIVWKTDTDYEVRDVVELWGRLFVCLVAHRSTVFANDWFNHKYWKEKE